MAVLLVKRRFPHAKGTLHEQLGASISVRRKRLIHRLRHADKLSFNREKVRSSRTRKHESAKSITGTQAEQKTHFAPRGMGLATKASSATNYSRMNAGMAWDRIRRQPALSTISMGSSVEDVTIEYLYPEPPQFNPTDKSIPCPYCRKPLPVLLLKGGSKSGYWRYEFLNLYEKQAAMRCFKDSPTTNHKLTANIETTSTKTWSPMSVSQNSVTSRYAFSEVRKPGPATCMASIRLSGHVTFIRSSGIVTSTIPSLKNSAAETSSRPTCETRKFTKTRPRTCNSQRYLDDSRGQLHENSLLALFANAFPTP
jgi:hypothetical protein